MAFNKGDGGIQYLRRKVVGFNFADVNAAGSGNFFGALDIPPDAILTGGGIMITQVFNSTSSDTFVIKDSVNTYATGLSGQSLGYKPLTATGIMVVTNAEGVIGLTWTPGSSAPTQGAGYLVIDYFIPCLADEFFTLADPIAP
jgi:hypothetical protein